MSDLKPLTPEERATAHDRAKESPPHSLMLRALATIDHVEARLKRGTAAFISLERIYNKVAARALKAQRERDEAVALLRRTLDKVDACCGCIRVHEPGEVS